MFKRFIIYFIRLKIKWMILEEFFFSIKFIFIYQYFFLDQTRLVFKELPVYLNLFHLFLSVLWLILKFISGIKIKNKKTNNWIIYEDLKIIKNI
jgi:hypothetical protein